MNVLVWTEDRIDQLEKLWADHSASQIAAILGVTRNAVVGKVHRLGLSGKVRPAAASRQPGVRRTTRRDCAMRMITLRSNEPLPVAPIGPVDALNISLADLRPFKCRWITNDDPRAPLYCAHDVVAGTDWCPSHYCIVYTPASERRRERPKAAA